MGRSGWESGCGGEEAEGVTRGDACLVLCLSLPVPWWNAESHERGPLSLSLSLRLVSCICLKSATVPLLTHYLSAHFSSTPKTPTATNTCENTHTHTQSQTVHAGRNTYRCALHTQLMSVKFPSNRKSELRQTNTQNPIILRPLNYYDYHHKQHFCHQQSHSRTSNMSSRFLVMRCKARSAQRATAQSMNPKRL